MRKKELINGGDPEAKFTLPGANDFGEADFIRAADLKEIGDALVESLPELSDLQEMKIIYLWKRKGPEKPRRKLGTCQSPGGLLEYFSGADFIICLMVNNCAALQVTKWSVEAIVYHELKHAGVIDGEPTMIPHDCECFAGDIRRYGLWKSDLEKIAEASNEALQLPFAIMKPIEEDPSIRASMDNLQKLADRDGVTLSIRTEGHEDVVLAKPDKSDDELYADAVQLVREFGKASTSLLQRRLRIGYGRASGLVDLMEARGVVGPANGPAPREVLPPPPTSPAGSEAQP
jgi:hypothetical protein